MKRSACVIAALLLSCGFAAPAAADTIEAASTCLTDNTSGKDRKALVKWIFLAMSTHPEIRDLAKAPPEVIEQANAEVGALYSRLIAQDCAIQIRAMVKEHGTAALAKPFEVLGAVAMGELMTNEAVSAFLGQIDKHMDAERIESVMKVE